MRREPPSQTVRCDALDIVQRTKLEVDASNWTDPAFVSPGAITFRDSENLYAPDAVTRWHLDGTRPDTLADAAVAVWDADVKGALIVTGSQPEARLRYADRLGGTIDLGAPAPVQSGAGPGRAMAGSWIGYCSSLWSIGMYDRASSLEYGSLAQEGPCSEPVWAAEGSILYITQDSLGKKALMYWKAKEGENAQAISRAERLQSPLLWGGSAFVLADGVALRIDLESREAQVVDEGPCYWQDASTAGIAMACGEASSSEIEPLASSVRFYDGRSVRTLVDGRRVLKPVLGDGFVAWTEYDAGAELCTGGRDLGSIRAATLSGSNELEVSRVDLGCLCCGRYWPEPFLSVEGDMLAFNYVNETPTRDGIRVEVVRMETIGCD